MVIGRFSVDARPRIEFGEGSIERVPALASALGRRALVVTGGRSLEASRSWPALVSGLEREGVAWERLRVEAEPSPGLVDDAVAAHRGSGVELVVAIGGGSALDAAKAVAALLPSGRSVLEHLEGVGRGVPFSGPALASIAVPTTAGTGSEATRNAVLGERGESGFKKSFRHDELMPRHAVVDPDLLASCPRATIAASGIDAVTQLVEAYVSPRASRFTDALVLDALAAARESLLAWHAGVEPVGPARAGMAYAALVSGIALSHAGLGAVHGLASPLGSRGSIPHGVVCGTLLASVTEANVRAMRAREPRNPALERYARLGAVLSGAEGKDGAPTCEALVETLGSWARRLEMPTLGAYGVRSTDLDAIVRAARAGSMNTNPVRLSDAELRAILETRL